MHNTKRQKNMIIGGLLAIVCIMAIGYAAFASNLNISGSGAISSNWSVKITNITSKDIVGSAGNKSTPTYTDTTATFATTLQSPGDSITYDITVSNEGTLDAKLDKITISNSNNPAITFEKSGLTEGNSILKGTSEVLTIKVTYNSSVTSQPDTLTANLTVTLDFVQKGVNSEGIVEPTVGDKLLASEGTVTTGDGLYADTAETGRYIYRGSSPNNYITFNDETWRIISVESDGTIKIIRNSTLSSAMAWDTENLRSATYCNKSSYGCNSWGSNTSTLNASGAVVTSMPREYGGTAYALPTEESTLNQYLNGTYYNSLSSMAQSQIESHMFNVGVLSWTNGQTIATDITQESAYKWKGKIALANASDYVRASTNSDCTSVYAAANYYCYSSNWMYYSSSSWLVLSPYSYSISYDVCTVTSNGFVSHGYARATFGVRPALYLRSDITLSGSGTSSDPYQITG